MRLGGESGETSSLVKVSDYEQKIAELQKQARRQGMTSWCRTPQLKLMSLSDDK